MIIGFIQSDSLDELNRVFPEISGPGNYPIECLGLGSAFERFVEDLKGPEMTRCFPKKFGFDLTGFEILAAAPRVMPGVRQCDLHRLHKVVTILFYFNKERPHEGGRLRRLRSADDLQDYEAEVSPEVRCDAGFPAQQVLVPRPQAPPRPPPHPADALGRSEAGRQEDA